MDELKSFLAQIDAEKYQECIFTAGFDSIFKLKSASDGHLKYLGIPMGIRKKISLKSSVGIDPPASLVHVESNAAGPSGQAATATHHVGAFARRTESNPLWSAASSGTDLDTNPHWERLIGQRGSGDMSGDKENLPLGHVTSTSLSLHEVQRLYHEEQKRAIGFVKDPVDGPKEVIVMGTKVAPMPKTLLSDLVGLRDHQCQRQANDETLGRLRALRAELRAAEEQVSLLKGMVAEIEQEISSSKSRQDKAGQPTYLSREVIEID